MGLIDCWWRGERAGRELKHFSTMLAAAARRRREADSVRVGLSVRSVGCRLCVGSLASVAIYELVNSNTLLAGRKVPGCSLKTCPVAENDTTMLYPALLLVLLLLGVGINGSDRKLDGCATCSGTNSTCRLVSGIFTRPQLPMGYNLITQLPQSACNLTVSELKQSRNYLALRRIDGSFVLNGNWAINWSGDFNAGGTPFSYTRDDDQHIEAIHSPGPLLEPLDLMLIYQQPNPGIKYQYQLPMVRAEHSAKESVIAPPLVRHPTPPNHIPEDHKPMENGVDARPTSSPLFPYGNPASGGGGDMHAYAGDEAVKSRPKRKRKFAWKITGFTECSRSCGGGIQTAVIACVREHNQLTVSDRRCSAFEKPPPQTVRCNLKPCVAE